MAISPLTVFDDFKRTSSTSWGTTASGHNWVGEWLADAGSIYSVSSSRGQATVPASNAIKLAYNTDTVDNASQELMIKVKVNQVNYRSDFGPAICVENTSNYYYARLQPNSNTVAIYSNIGGVHTIESTSTAFTFAADTYYWVRLRRSGTTLSLKIWAASGAEPGSFTVTCSLNGSGPGAGNFGFYTQGTTASFTTSIDTLYWYTLEDTEPEPPVTDSFTRSTDHGWGMSDTGHLWRGNFSDDPEFYAETGLGSVISSGYGTISTAAGGGSPVRFGYIGPSMTEVEVISKASLSSANGSTSVGARASYTSASGVVVPSTGYYARLVYGSTSFSIQELNSGTSTSLGTFALGAAPTTDEIWWIKLQCTGTTIRARAWKDGTAEPGTWGVSVTDATHTSGVSFFRYGGNNAADITLKLYDFSSGPILTGTSLTTGTITTGSLTDTSFTITAPYTGDSDADSSCVIQYKLDGDETWISPTVTTNRGPKTFTASATGLLANRLYRIQATYTDPDGVTGTNPQTKTQATLGLTTRIPPSALSIRATTDTSVTVRAQFTNDTDDDNSAGIKSRAYPAGSFGSSTAMTRTDTFGRQDFEYTVTGLSPDTTYEFQVTYTDADGIEGTNAPVITATTRGTNVELVGTATVVTTALSAAISVPYLYDSNDNSSLEVMYKPTFSTLWTVVPSTGINVNRTSNTFSVNINGLYPGVTYEMSAIISDPDGVAPGTEDTVTTLFSTKSALTTTERRSKYYLYKVYSIDDEYLGTWRDTPTPEFSFYENGGVADLLVQLPRRLGDVHNDPTIQLGNRVSVWAIDGRSNGIGTNLVEDYDMELGSWTLATSWAISSAGGPDNSQALGFSSVSTTPRITLSETLEMPVICPVVARCLVRAKRGKLRMDLNAYDDTDTLIASSDDYAESIRNSWQELKLEWTPPDGTSYIRVSFQNVGASIFWVDKVQVLRKELLVYEGEIESWRVQVNSGGESLEIKVLGHSRVLNDDYIDFLQYASFQPSKDASALRTYSPPEDPSQVFKDLVDVLNDQNPRSRIYYTSESVDSTGFSIEYTFRDQEFANCFDKMRDLCPPSWHYFIEPDGLLRVRDPDTVTTHHLRLNVEIMDFDYEYSVMPLKNVIRVKGRQDEDKSEPDHVGNITHIEFDQESINLYGRRVSLVRDAQIHDLDTAELYALGRLEELNQVEQRITCVVPAEGDLQYTSGSLLGYNIESFKPGDYVMIYDPVSGASHTRWDRFLWNDGTWDSASTHVLPEPVPIKKIEYHGSTVTLELSERQPSTSGAFAKLARHMQSQEADSSD